MKVNSSVRDKEPETQMDITEIIHELQKTNKSIFIQSVDGQIFIYRPLGRAEFKRLLSDDRLTDIEKEDVICQACTLWPEEYNFDTCEAGVPTILSKAILKNSFLDSIDSRKMIISYFRQEMFDLDNQITCIINEAFPQFDIEDIEQWDIAKTAKYLSRAEWKLQNLRGATFSYDPFTGDNGQEQPEQDFQTPITTEIEDPAPGKIETLEERQKRLNMKGTAKEKMTPEKIAELKAKFPEIDWDKDTILREGIDGMKESVDTVSPALRPGR